MAAELLLDQIAQEAEVELHVFPVEAEGSAGVDADGMPALIHFGYAAGSIAIAVIYVARDEVGEELSLLFSDVGDGVVELEMGLGHGESLSGQGEDGSLLAGVGLAVAGEAAVGALPVADAFGLLR